MTVGPTALTTYHNKINWNKVTPEQKYDYSLNCKKLLSEIRVPVSVLKCKTPLCNDSQYVAFIENFYEQIIFAIKTASKDLLASKHKKTNNFIYGWNNSVKRAHVTARAAYLNWIKNGKIRNGKYYKTMKSSRRSFKYALRKCRRNYECHQANALALALHSRCNAPKSFWSKIRSSNNHCSLLASVGGVKDAKNIAEMWKKQFFSLLNTSSSSDATEFVDFKLQSFESYCNLFLAECTIDTISPLIHKLKLNCAPGVDGIFAEPFCYCDSSIKEYMCDLFNMCLYHGIIPKSCTDTLLVPIIKNKNKNVYDVSNYRPIAFTTVVSKLFESYMLHRLIHFLKTNNNQFGFKPNHGTDMSVFLLKQVASSYVSRDTSVFAVFLDASKAFDKVDHEFLFKKLILRNVPLYFIWLLRY